MRVGTRITPMSKALSTPPMVGGVDFRLTLCVVIASVMFTLILQIWYVPIFGYILFYILKQINKEDPMMMRVLQPYTKQGSFYVPFPKYKYRRHDRPTGFGRGNI